MNEYNSNEYSMSEYDIRSLQVPCPQLTVVATAAPPKPLIFSYCWNTPTVITPCGFTGTFPVIVVGSSFEIAIDTYNTGGTGKAKAVFKDGTTIIGSVENSSFPTCTGNQCTQSSYQWYPKVKYTMPNRTVQLAMEVYGWDIGKNTWVLTDSKSAVISTSTPGCAGIDLVPFSASIKTGEKVDMIASVSPGNVPFTVTFKDRIGTILGSCKTSGMGQATGSSACPFTWDSVTHGGNKAGTYYVKAYTNGCYSTECIIEVNAPILQRNLNVTVVDSVTGVAIPGATVMVTISTTGPQSKLTDANGYATFRVDMGSVSVSISKNGYVTTSTIESIYMDKNITYQLTPIPPIPTVGAIEFVSVPVGASIFIDGNDTGQKTVVTIGNIPAGSHTWILKFTGYNDSSGSVTVPSNGSTSVYATLTPVTPTMGSLNITSTPMDAEVWIDGKDFKVTTSGATIITNIPPGNHTLTLTLPGFQDKITTFAIIAGQTTYLNPTLIPLTTIGSLEISSEPSGARVFIDDADTQRITPATITNLIKGSHTYKLVLDGYTDSSGTFNIEIEKITIVHVILEKKTGAPGTGLLVVGIAGLAIVAVIMKKKE